MCHLWLERVRRSTKLTPAEKSQMWKAEKIEALFEWETGWLYFKYYVVMVLV